MTLDPSFGPPALWIAAGTLTLSALVGVLGPRFTRIALALAAAASVAWLAAGAVAALGGPFVARPWSILGLAVELRYDALGAAFLVALGIVGSAASVHAIGHQGAVRSRLDSVAYPVFLGSLGLLFGADGGFTFLLAWEGMALSSAALVFGARPGPVAVRAGYVYVALTHLATAALVAAFALLAGPGGRLDFASMRDVARTLDPAVRDGIFLLLLVGFATKAGIVPFHVWLPRAHPEAPSHVSALMSGVMVKAGVFGMLRVVLEVLGPGPAWWAVLVLALGATSAVLGALYALAERDFKRLLAFSTIENLGIIWIGLGVALLGASTGLPALVALGVAAVLVHAVNHATFKGLLFLAAGTIQSAAGSRDLDRLGGLARAMPWTALVLLVGTVSLAAVPPFNGFAGEWLTFQGLLAAGAASSVEPVIRFACVIAVGGLALSAGLALGAIVKAAGSALLARPRSAAAAAATEPGRIERSATILLAAVAIALGILAAPMRELAGDVAATVGPVAGASTGLAGAGLASAYLPAALAALLGLLVVAGWAVARLRARRVRTVPTWACGIEPTVAFEYTATSFDKPARLFFEPILRPIRSRTVELEPGTPFPHRVTYRSNVDHLVESRVYVPLQRASITFSQLARRLQHGSIQLYVAYMVVALVVLLVVARP